MARTNTNGGVGSGVTSLNTLTGALSLLAGTGILITPSGSGITIALSGGGIPTLAQVIASDAHLGTTPIQLSLVNQNILLDSTGHNRILSDAGGNIRINGRDGAFVIQSAFGFNTGGLPLFTNLAGLGTGVVTHDTNGVLGSTGPYTCPLVYFSQSRTMVNDTDSVFMAGINTSGQYTIGNWIVINSISGGASISGTFSYYDINGNFQMENLTPVPITAAGTYNLKDFMTWMQTGAGHQYTLLWTVTLGGGHINYSHGHAQLYYPPF